MVRPISRALAGALGLTVMVAMLAIAAPALAKSPKGEFAVFQECPTNNAAVEDCIIAKTEAGEFTIGKEEVPIVKPITLQGGVAHFFTGEEEVFYGAEKEANTLTKAPQKVPGGLAGLVKCNLITNFIERLACEAIFENGVTGVNATTELAAPASAVKVNAAALNAGAGTALKLPLKVHLENPLLGSSCYIGSNAHPIVIEFTSGTTSPPPPNKPITGKTGELSFTESGILKNTGNELVNNSYGTGGAEGCGGLFSFIIDPIVNSKLGLPSEPGHNTAILKGLLEVTTVENVKAHE